MRGIGRKLNPKRGCFVLPTLVHLGGKSLLNSLTNEANKCMMNSKICNDYPLNPYPRYYKSHNGLLMADGANISYKFLMMTCPL